MIYFSSLLKRIAHEPASYLEGRILSALDTERERLIEKKSRLAFFVVGMSAVAFFGALIFVGSTLIQSEFWSLLTLLFSDLGVIVSASQDFLYSLLETLPIVPLIALLPPLAIFFWSLGSLLSLGEKGEHPGFRSATFIH